MGKDLLLLHEVPCSRRASASTRQLERHPCVFQHLFDVTPRELIEQGVYNKMIALNLAGDEWRQTGLIRAAQRVAATTAANATDDRNMKGPEREKSRRPRCWPAVGKQATTTPTMLASCIDACLRRLGLSARAVARRVASDSEGPWLEMRAGPLIERPTSGLELMEVGDGAPLGPLGYRHLSPGHMAAARAARQSARSPTAQPEEARR